MNSPTDFPSQTPDNATPSSPHETRALYWSVRRELWENRSLYLAPLLVAAVVLFGAMIGALGLPRKVRAAALDPAKLHATLVKPFTIAPAPIMLATFLVGLFYSLDALYGERRDRSILFWKSLPVSDLTTVLSKASIPLVVLPVIAFVLSIATVGFMMFMSSSALLVRGLNPGLLWSEYRFVQEPLVMIYGLLVHALWFAPIYAWLLLVSAWARRLPLLWATFPLLAIPLAEKVVFNSTYFANMLRYRVVGAMSEAFDVTPRRGMGPMIEGLAQLSPIRFLSAPGLWAGLFFAAAFLAAAVRLRRNREPI